MSQTNLQQWDEHDLDALSDAQRRAWIHVEVGDMTVREYAQKAGLSSPGTVSSYLARARKKLGLACEGCDRYRLADELQATPDGRLCGQCTAEGGWSE